MELIVPDIKIDFKELISGFAFPLDIKNDIIYCQKSLRTYIRAHQAIVARMGNNTKIPSVRKCLDELEKEICEINSEQKLLLVRLRCALDDYYLSLKNDNVDVDYELGNGYISRMFSGCIDDPNYLCEPINITRRLNEKELIEKFMPEELLKKTPEPVELLRPFSHINPRQISLLKPKSERFAQKSSVPNIIERCIDFKEKQKKVQESIKSQEKEQGYNKPLTLTSPAINNSRMRLLQALQKAQTMNALKTRQQSSVVLQSKINYEAKSPQSSTSDESPDTRETSPSFSDEPTDPTDFSQEMFLKMFGLYSLEHSKYLTQRRSKRKRRNVQNNEKSDYHYGNLDLLDSPQAEKKKKEYLFAAPSTRGRKRKLGIERDMPTCSKISSDRSNSSSPTDDKVRVICNECLKEGDTPLCRCENCNGVFHTKCQKGAILRQPLKFREKCCPTCYRIKQRDTIVDESPTPQQEEQQQKKQTPQPQPEKEKQEAEQQEQPLQKQSKQKSPQQQQSPEHHQSPEQQSEEQTPEKPESEDEQEEKQESPREEPKTQLPQVQKPEQQKQPEPEVQQQKPQQKPRPQPQQQSDNQISELRLKSIGLIENRNRLVEKYNELHKRYESYYIRNRGLVNRSDIFKTKLNKLLHIIGTFK